MNNRAIRNGIYGYLGDYLLKIVSVTGGYEFSTHNWDLIEEYHFIEKRSLYTQHVYYRLPIQAEATIRAYHIRTLAKYRGLCFFADGIIDEDQYLLFPTEEAMRCLNDYPKHGYDPMYKANEEDITDVWEEWSAVKGFIFEEVPIIHLKKDGKWLIWCDIVLTSETEENVTFISKESNDMQTWSAWAARSRT